MQTRTPIDLQAQFKSRLDYVKQAIQKTLGMGVSPTNAYEIMAASQGLPNYQTAKGLSEMPFYAWGYNAGSIRAPYYLTKNIGHCRSSEEAMEKGKALLDGSPELLVWLLLEDGVPTNMSHVQKGTWVSKIDLSDMGHTLRSAIENQVSSLFVRNKNGEFSIDYQTALGQWVRDNDYDNQVDINSVWQELRDINDQAKKQSEPLLPNRLFFSLHYSDRQVDFLVLFEPSVLSIKVYDPSYSLEINKILDDTPAFNQLLHDVASSQSGLFVFEGMSGCGKTTAAQCLFSRLNEIPSNRPYLVDDQIDHGDRTELLKKMMRADPDVTFVGELHSKELVFNALAMSEKTVVVAEVTSAEGGTLDYLTHLGVNEANLVGRFKGVYTQHLLPSTNHGQMATVAYYHRVGKPLNSIRTALLNEASRIGTVPRDEALRRFG